jgi:hypothetical protein
MSYREAATTANHPITKPPPSVTLPKDSSITLHQKDPKNPVLSTETYKEIANRISASILQHFQSRSYPIQSVHRHPKSKDLVVTFKRKEDAVYLSKSNQWVSGIHSGLMMKIPVFGVVVHRMPTSFNPDDADHRKSFVDQNMDILSLEQDVPIEWLGRQDAESVAKRNSKTFSSLIVKFRSRQAANKAINDGFLFDYQSLPAVKSTPPLLQCYSCQGFGHVAKTCKNSPACSHCAENHPTKDCPRKCSAETPCSDASPTRPCEHFEKPACSNCKAKSLPHDHRVSDPACPSKKLAKDAATNAALAQGHFYGDFDLAEYRPPSSLSSSQ